MRLKKKKVQANFHYSNFTFVRGAYKKALLVISGCKNEYHIKGARKYLHNFLMFYSKEIGYKSFETDDFVLKMFDRLKLNLLKKERELGI